MGELDDLLVDGLRISLDLYFNLFFYFFHKGQVYLLQGEEALFLGARVLALEGELAVEPPRHESVVADQLSRARVTTLTSSLR